MAKINLFTFLLFFDQVFGIFDSENCGVSLGGGKIVGGVDSGGYRYPWFALLLLKENSRINSPVCAGSLITKSHILTAAHCFTINPTVPSRDLFKVALGAYDICDENESTREILDVADVIIHEMYQRRKKFYDIALIKLERPADFTVICLPLLGVPDMTETALIIGFGALGENLYTVPCHMMEANVTKYSKEDCSKTFLPLEDKKESSIICAGSLEGKTDSCYGDSGGPLQTINSEGRYVLAGIVSYGYGCATPQIPGIYTNVGSYIQWIENNIMKLGNTGRNVKTRFNNFSQRNFPRKQQSKVVFPTGSDNYGVVNIRSDSKHYR